MYGFGLPVDISTHGHDIDHLIKVIHVFMAVLFVGWGIFLIYTLLRFRARQGHKAEYHVKHFKLPTYAEAGVVIFEVLLLFAFSFPTWDKAHAEFAPGTNFTHIRVIAEQFAWNVHYPGKDGVFGASKAELMNSGNPTGLDPDDPAGKDDITTINQLVIPVNTPVQIDVTSKDVIHSFGLTVARVKQDVVPGQKIPVRFQTFKTGDFEIACAQLCGLGHYRMRGFFLVRSQEDFDKWMNEQIAQKSGSETVGTSA